MIIDCHVHIGNKLSLQMNEGTVIQAMQKYSIDCALVSNGDSTEADHRQFMLPDEIQTSQINSLKRTLKFARENPDKIFAAAWVKPRLGKADDGLKSLIEKNLDIIKAIKIHPYHSAIAFDDPKNEEFIKLAADLKLAVITHTAGDFCSQPGHVYDMAKKYPEVDFVMAHLGLGTDNAEAIKICAELPNVYGDTAWVSMESAIRFVKEAGSEKLFFGSDMPIDGMDTYAVNRLGERSVYQYYFYELDKEISKEEYENIMYKNAVRFYKLPFEI